MSFVKTENEFRYSTPISDRVILHCDMNNFYASVECLNDPSLRGKCVAVCGSQEDRHGIVLAKNYAAKAYGVITGEAVWQAKQKCRNLVIVEPHYDEYLKYSQIAREIYSDYTDMIEPFGMDECWLDVTGSRCLYSKHYEKNESCHDTQHGFQIANEIRERIKNETGLTISVGVSWNKIFAKLGSDLKKPDAVTVIDKSTFKEKIFPLAASELLGVGPATNKVLKMFGIHTIGDLAAADELFMKLKFGKVGLILKGYANGYDFTPVAKQDYEFPIKSVGHGTTALHDLNTYEEVWPIMLSLSQDIGQRLREVEKRACGVSITIKDNELSCKEWQCRLSRPTMNSGEIAKSAYSLFTKNWRFYKPIRALTVRAISLTDDDRYQLDVFFESDNILKQEKLDFTIDTIRHRFGNDSIKNATLIKSLPIPKENTELIMPSGFIQCHSDAQIVCCK